MHAPAPALIKHRKGCGSNWPKCAQKDIQIKDLKEANTSLRGSNSLADTARDPKTGKGMATGHVPVKNELDIQATIFRHV